MAASREVPHQRESEIEPADRKCDGKNDVERRQPDLAALIEQDGIEREGRERRVPAEDAGGQEQPQVLRYAAFEGEISDEQAHHQRAAHVLDECGVIEAGPEPASDRQVDAVAQRGTNAATDEYDQET